MLGSSLKLCRALSELRITSPRLPVMFPIFTPPVSHLRTGLGQGSHFNKVNLKEEELPEGQSIVKLDPELRDETLKKINNVLDEGPGRMFAVVHVRGFQHKVTDGKLLTIC